MHLFLEAETECHACTGIFLQANIDTDMYILG